MSSHAAQFLGLTANISENRFEELLNSTFFQETYGPSDTDLRRTLLRGSVSWSLKTATETALS